MGGGGGIKCNGNLIILQRKINTILFLLTLTLTHASGRLLTQLVNIFFLYICDSWLQTKNNTKNNFCFVFFLIYDKPRPTAEKHQL